MVEDRESSLHDAVLKYNQRLDDSVFRKNQSLRIVGGLCVNGQFDVALNVVEEQLEKSKISVVEDSDLWEWRKKTKIGYTELKRNGGVFYYPDNFSKRSTLNKLINHVHKYKSWLLRRDGIRTDQNVDQILETDLALLDICEVGGANMEQVNHFKTAFGERLKWSKQKQLRKRKIG